MQNISVAILGAGKLAHSLVAALINAGIKVGCIFSKTSLNAKTLAKEYHIPVSTNSLSDIPSTTSHFFITVTDSTIADVAEQLSVTHLQLHQKFVIHFSGVLSSRILSAIERNGAMTGSMHILQSFPSKQIVSIKNCAAGIESNSNICFEEMKRIALLLDMKPFAIDAGNKSLYHVLGILVSNFITGNLAAAEELFHCCGITGISFADLAIPIAMQTIQNARLTGTVTSLSGPVERNDLQTIETHLSALGIADGLNYSKELYAEQTKYLIHVAQIKNPQTDYSAISRIIETDNRAEDTSSRIND